MPLPYNREVLKLTTWARGPPKRGSPDPQDHPPPSWIRPWILTLRSGKRVPNNRKRPKEENAILPLCCSPPLLLVAVPHDTHTDSRTVGHWGSRPPPPPLLPTTTLISCWARSEMQLTSCQARSREGMPGSVSLKEFRGPIVTRWDCGCWGTIGGMRVWN